MYYSQYDHDSPSRIIEREEYFELRKKAIESLSESDKTLIYYKFELEMDYKQIGEKLGKSAGAIQQRFIKIRKRLKQFMENNNE